MSIRASIISFVLRRTLRKQLTQLHNPIGMREQMNKPLGKTPEQVQVDQVTAQGVVAEWVSWPGCSTDSAIVYFHGGGYVFGSPAAHRALAGRLAKEAGVRVLMVDYRLAPEHPFPAAVEDATAAYRWLIDEGIDANNIVVAGDSAGGGLSVALMVNLKRLAIPQPKAAVLVSPWVDLARTGESMTTNAETDAMLTPEAMRRFAELYLGEGNDPRAPLASPVFADLSGLPPMLITVGSTEILLSDSQRLRDKLVRAGGEATLDVWPKMPHAFPIMGRLIPEAKQCVADIASFIRSHLGTTELD